MPDTPGTINYPTTLDSSTSLMDVKNNASTTLTATLNSGDLTATVADATLFSSSGAFTCESEIVYYTGTTGTTLTGLIRGQETTVAATHASGATIDQRITARTHTVLRDALVATQTRLGVGSASPALAQVLKGTGTGSADWTALITAIYTSSTAETVPAAGQLFLEEYYEIASSVLELASGALMSILPPNDDLGFLAGHDNSGGFIEITIGA